MFARIKFSSLLRNINQFSLIRFIFYLSIILVDLRIQIDSIQRWHPLLTQYFYLPLPNIFYDESYLLLIKYFYLIFCLFCAIGFCTRVFSTLSFIFGAFFYFLYHSTGVSDHQFFLNIKILFFFAIYENFKSFTFKQLIFIVQLTFSLIFFHAGLTKLLRLGLDWVSADVVLDYLMLVRLTLSPYRFDLENGLTNLFFIRSYNNFKYLFYLIPLIELLAPLMLIKRFRYFFLFFLIMQLAIYYVMFISFIPFMGAYAFFLVPIFADLIYKSQAKQWN